MANSNGDINTGAKENIRGTILWMQLGAYAGFGSAALSVIGLVRSFQMGTVIGLAIGIYLAVTLLQQSQKLKQYADNDDIQAYEDSLTFENSYWLTMMILMGLLVVALILGTLAVLTLGSR